MDGRPVSHDTRRNNPPFAEPYDAGGLEFGPACKCGWCESGIALGGYWTCETCGALVPDYVIAYTLLCAVACRRCVSLPDVPIEYLLEAA